MFNDRAWVEEQIAWYTEQIVWVDKMIAQQNTQIKESRQVDVRFANYVLGQDDVTEFEKEIYGKGYVGAYTKILLKERNLYYRWRKSYRQNLAQYQRELAEYTA